MYSGTEMGVPAMLPNTMSGSWQERTYDVLYCCEDLMICSPADPDLSLRKYQIRSSLDIN